MISRPLALLLLARVSGEEVGPVKEGEGEEGAGETNSGEDVNLLGGKLVILHP